MFLLVPLAALVLLAMLWPSPGGPRPRNHPPECECGGSGEVLILDAPAFRDLYPCERERPDDPTS